MLQNAIVKIIRRLVGFNILIQEINKTKNQIEHLNDENKKINTSLMEMEKNYARDIVKKRKRLFISTGFFGTFIAATIARYENGFDDYLLITLDRQEERKNIDWAFKVNTRWENVRTISHEDYYNVGLTSLNTEWNDIEFHEVYSSHHQMMEFVKKNFKATKYKIYEEGVATRYHESTLDEPKSDEIFYTIQPKKIKNPKRYLVQIPKKTIIEILSEIDECYDITEISGNNNILFIMPGVVPGKTAQREFIDQYVNIFNYLCQQGYQVWIARHPRAVNFPKPEDIGAAKIITDDVPIIEQFIYKNRTKIKYIMGLYSTILCDSDYLYGIQSLSISGEMGDDLQTEFKRFQDNLIPSANDYFVAIPSLFN